MKLSPFGGHSIHDHEIKSSLESIGSQTTITNINKSQADSLKSLAITDYEQFISIASKNELKKSFSQSLDLSEGDLDEIMGNLSKVMDPTVFASSSKQTQEFPTGAFKPKDPSNKNIELFEVYVPDSKFSVASDITKNRISKLIKSVIVPESLASSVNYVRQLPRVRNQANRGTCVAHAVTCINEFAFSRTRTNTPDLSEQHLYYETKLLDQIPNECGTYIVDAMKVLATVGQCEEDVWSYNPNGPCNQNWGEPSSADQNALQFKNFSIQLNPHNVQSIKGFLAQGKLIAFSIPVFKSWYQSAETVRSGRITMPLPGERETSGHAMTMVGYQDQQDYPGGGYFIVRNSWGEQYWGYQNIYAPGYGTIPYAYISEFNWEAFCIA